MDYAHVCNSVRSATLAFQEFIENEKDNIRKVDKANRSVIMHSGSRHCFMDECEYIIWRIGRTYRRADDVNTLLDSGYPVKDG